MSNFWKGKKVIAYIALAHHTRFITPVMEMLSEKGASIQYIVGQAERSQEITAIQLNIAYTHVFDYLSDSDHEEIMQNYRRLTRTFSKSLKHDFFLGINPVTVTDKTLLSTALEHTGFKNLFKAEKPDICFALHEINRWGKMFAFWAKKSNIPFISLQEGLSYGLDFGLSGHAQYSSLNLVWGQRIKNKLIHFEAPEAKIHAVGNTHLAKEIAHQEKNKIRDKIRKKYHCKKSFVGLLVLSAQLPDPALFKVVFKTVSQDDSLHLFVKFHPACKRPKYESWINEIKPAYKKNIVFVHAQESTYDLISACDVVILGQKSTTGLESLAFGKPLVKLDFAYIEDAPYSFVDKGVAVKMSADELSKKLADKTDFSSLTDKKKIKEYLQDELADTSSSIHLMCDIFKNSIKANQSVITGLTLPKSENKLKWSICIQASDTPQNFLAQLEAVAVNSEGCGRFETFIIVKKDAPDDIITIIDSLQGDVRIVWVAPEENAVDKQNQAMTEAAGDYFVFLEKNLAPLQGWLAALEKGFETDDTLMAGGCITDTSGNIANAGMVIDHNNAPVSAYRHLRLDFEPVCKKRCFQMIDYLIAMPRKVFFDIGGFTPEAGRLRFLDACLKAAQVHDTPEPATYLPDSKLIFLEQLPGIDNMNDSVFFFSKWHNMLWESESRLYREDGVTREKLEQAKISAAIQAFR